MLIFKFVFVWVAMFLVHELMHIKSQGLRMEGFIHVHPSGFTCEPDIYTNSVLCSYAGGIYTSMICFFLAVVTTDIAFQFSFFTCGWVQLVYGLYEGWLGVRYRYYIYAVVVVVCSVFWWVIE